MPDCDKLLARARQRPANLRFSELCALAECYGFTFARQKGSHRLYTRPGWPRPMNFQDVKGQAKSTQVKQLLAAIDELEEN